MNPAVYAAFVRLWRLGVVVLAAFLLHQTRPLPGPADPATLSEARAFFPATETLSAAADGTQTLLDKEGEIVGFLVTTSPAADHLIGYSGPSNLLVALNKDGSIVGTKILSSADTPAHVEALGRSGLFAESLLGWKPASQEPPKIEGMAGSTLTGLAMVEAIAQRLSGRHGSLRFPEPVTIDEARAFFPNAAQLHPDAPRPGWCRVDDLGGALAGYVVRTSPASDTLNGYAGPTECLLAVAPDMQTLLKVVVRKSYDTEDYVARVTEDGDYLKSLTRWKVGEWPSLDFSANQIEGVAGATMTSAAIAEGLRERFKMDARSVNAPPAKSVFNLPSARDIALWVVVCAAVLQAFTSVRGNKWVRLLWQAFLIAGLGIWLGQSLSLGLFAGWARNGVPWRQSLPLVSMAAAALAVPWAGRRQLYCHHVCPHGAAQEWLSRLPIPKLTLSNRLHATLRLLPGCLLALAFLAALRAPGLPLGNLEPFDFWALGKAAVVPAVLAVAGLALSCVIPMAYCRYGCPTGALLGFVRTSARHESLGARDGVAALVLALGAWSTMGSAPPQTDSVPNEMRGTAFGTTWSIKLRGHAPHPSLRGALASEVERIEATLSSWRPESATSRFNANPSVEDQTIPEELGRLVRFAQRLAKATSGAYDITVAPLVNAWGYGPKGEVSQPPSDADLADLLKTVGFEKLELNEDDTRLRKAHPLLSMDFGSVLQGYAVDRLCMLLDGAGCPEYLVEVGGELRAKGAWKVAIENPQDARNPLKIMELRDAALATSGLARARKRLENRPVSHIISPHTGRPVEPALEVCSVISPTCLEADGWATAVIASGLSEAEALCEKEQLVAWILDAAGRFRKLGTSAKPEP